MDEISQRFGGDALAKLAAAKGVAVSVVNGQGIEVWTGNNNSICRSLNPSDTFSPECSRDCGQALEKARAANGPLAYECHAGLECRAVNFQTEGSEYVAIVGRTFVKSDSYRKAADRAVTGDWSRHRPTEFFENILLTGDPAVLDKTMLETQSVLASAFKPSPQKGPAAGREAIPRINQLVERFNKEFIAGGTNNPDPSPIRDTEAPSDLGPADRAREAAAQPAGTASRSFFGSITQSRYLEAASAFLEFLADKYGLSGLSWLQAGVNKFEVVAAFGEMSGRHLRLPLGADDPNLRDAWTGGYPHEIVERKGGGENDRVRVLSLFPIGVDGDISAAVGVLDPLPSDETRRQIARLCRFITPQFEILRLREAVKLSEAMSSAVRSFSSGLRRIDSDDIWLTLTQNAAEILKAERASLLTFDERLNGLDIKALVGAKGMPAPGEEIGGRVSKFVYDKSQPIAIADVTRTGLPPAPPDRGYRTPSFMSCPVSIAGRTIGVMNFADRASGQAFDKTSLELFLAFAPQLAIAVDRASLKERAGRFEQLSVTDPLTGLLNRRYIEARLAEEIKRSNRHGSPMSFMMVDVDHFKSYNDGFGHPAGDEALKLVSNVISDTLRGADVAARYGGEEFAILLPQTSAEEAAVIGERLRGNVARTKFPHRSVSVSIGIATCSAHLCVAKDLVEAADKALYAAKGRGRNRVFSFESKTDGPTH